MRGGGAADREGQELGPAEGDARRGVCHPHPRGTSVGMWKGGRVRNN